jgi:hypothetical protein
MRFEAVKMWTVVYWFMTLGSLVARYQRFEEIYYHVHLHGK